MTKVGRPRGFDRNKALKEAMFLFWKYGYEATSLSQLKAKMGNISSPSFYLAFGSKEELFKEASQYYIDHYAKVIKPLWNESLSSKEAIEKTLKQALDMQYDNDHPLGCMIALNTVMVRLEENQHVAEILNEYRIKIHQGFIHCIQRGINSGELISSIDSIELATIFDSFLIGVSSLARENVDKQEIESGINKLLTLLN
jgi:TetR/AcrR family transcriptional regulator, copper-responsive repressor